MNSNQTDRRDLLTLDELKEKFRSCNYAALARRLDVTRQAISQIVSGKRKPGPGLLRKLGLREIVVYEKVRRADGER